LMNSKNLNKMAVEILTDKESGQQVMICNTTMTPFGVVYNDDVDLTEFLEWLPRDPRTISSHDLAVFFNEWQEEVEAESDTEIRKAIRSISKNDTIIGSIAVDALESENGEADFAKYIADQYDQGNAASLVAAHGFETINTILKFNEEK